MSVRPTADIEADWYGMCSAAGRMATAQDAIDSLKQVDALRPPCPTCGGIGKVRNVGHFDNVPSLSMPCPDCVDGKVPIERLVKVFECVHSDAAKSPYYHWTAGFNYLRDIR